MLGSVVWRLLCTVIKMHSQAQMTSLIETCRAEAIIARLSPHLSAKRKQKIEAVISRRAEGIAVGLESTYDIHNANAVVRSMDCLGFDVLHMISPATQFSPTRRITRGAGNWVFVHQQACMGRFIAQAKKSGVGLAAATPEAELTSESIPLDRPLCLLFGNEHEGLSQQALDSVDYRFRLPMYGMTQSFNLSVSVALTLNNIRQRLGEFDRVVENLLFKRAFYYMNSINSKHLQVLMQENLIIQ